MIPRLQIAFPCRRQWQFCFGAPYQAAPNECLLNHARTGIYLALKAANMQGKRVGVVSYNCHTVANAVEQAGAIPVFLDVDDQLRINLQQTQLARCDAIIITNLFGIRNNIAAIRTLAPQALLIVDNAHGYGLPPEGDVTVYSINQGKFPSLGEGGILCVNNNVLRPTVERLYKALPMPTHTKEIRLFFAMLAKALLYSPPCYWLVHRMKSSRTVHAEHSALALSSMAMGVRRIYQAVLPTIQAQIQSRQVRAAQLADVVMQHKGILRAWYGENAFMLIVECENAQVLECEKQWFLAQGIETETHFKNAILWAREFGYIEGTCPQAEQFTERLLMVPTYAVR